MKNKMKFNKALLILTIAQFLGAYLVLIFSVMGWFIVGPHFFFLGLIVTQLMFIGGLIMVFLARYLNATQ